MKTTIEIASDIYPIVAEYFADKISGAVYYENCRPLDSTLEDAVVIVPNVSAEQIQLGKAKINVFIPDVDCGSGRYVPDIARIEEVSSHDEAIVTKLNDTNSDYLFELSASTTFLKADGIEQHFVNINIELKRITF